MMWLSSCNKKSILYWRGNRFELQVDIFSLLIVQPQNIVATRALAFNSTRLNTYFSVNSFIELFIAMRWVVQCLQKILEARDGSKRACGLIIQQDFFCSFERSFFTILHIICFIHYHYTRSFQFSTSIAHIYSIKYFQFTYFSTPRSFHPLSKFINFFCFSSMLF